MPRNLAKSRASRARTAWDAHVYTAKQQEGASWRGFEAQLVYIQACLERDGQEQEKHVGRATRASSFEGAEAAIYRCCSPSAGGGKSSASPTCCALQCCVVCLCIYIGGKFNAG